MTFRLLTTSVGILFVQGFLGFSFLGSALVFAQGTGPTTEEIVTIAVVRDGSPSDENLVPRIEAELSKHVPGGMIVRFKDSPEFNAG